LMFTVALRLPAAVGLKVIAIVHFAPAARLVPQVFLITKSPALAPPTVIFWIAKVIPPTLVKLTGMFVLLVPTVYDPKLRVVAESDTEVSPVPWRPTICGLLGALSATETLAEREPSPWGVKLTLIVQLAPGPSEAPQVFVWAKSAGLDPVKVTPPMLSVAVPLFVTEIAWEAAVVFQTWFPNDNDEGERVACA